MPDETKKPVSTGGRQCQKGTGEYPCRKSVYVDYKKKKKKVILEFSFTAILAKRNKASVCTSQTYAALLLRWGKMGKILDKGSTDSCVPSIIKNLQKKRL